MENITDSIKLNPHYRHNGAVFNCIIMEHCGHRYFLTCCLKDTVYAFRNGVGLYVLSVGHDLSYIGLNSYMLSEADPVNSWFLHSTQEIKQALGPGWKSMNPETIASRLMGYLC